MLYPALHVNRPRFFTIVVLQSYLFQLIRLKVGGESWIENLKKVEFAYKYYADWLDKGNVDLYLPAFKLTSRQMFWLTYVHVTTEKYHFGVPKRFDIAHQLTNQYMNVLLKNITEFREDFQCGEMSPKEKQLLQEFQNKKKQVQTASYKICLHTLFHCSKENMANFEDPELFKFIKSVLTDPIHFIDQQTIACFLRNNTENSCGWTTHSKLLTTLSLICPSYNDCIFSF